MHERLLVRQEARKRLLWGRFAGEFTGPLIRTKASGQAESVGGGQSCERAPRKRRATGRAKPLYSRLPFHLLGKYRAHETARVA